MGATKMIMERALLARSDVQPFSTARFANVAFSDGSLPFGFCNASPSSSRYPRERCARYFISHQEAGELCVLSCGLGITATCSSRTWPRGWMRRPLPTSPATCSRRSATPPWMCQRGRGEDTKRKAASGRRKRQVGSGERQAEGAKRQVGSGERQAEGAKRQVEAESGRRGAQALTASRFALSARLALLFFSRAILPVKRSSRSSSRRGNSL